MISLRAFSYRYPGEQELALKDLDLHIPAGQFCAVVGANGAGKSTLCYALSGFVPHFYLGEVRGELRVGEKDISKVGLAELAGEIGLVFQDPFNQISGARFTVQEEIAFGLENLGVGRAEIKRRIHEMLELLRLEETARRSPFELSGGQQQRVAIASILAMRPKVLVLDEPTSQLDPHGTAQVFEILDTITRRQGTTVVLVEQKLEWLAEFADRVIVMDQGRIVLDGGPREILGQARLRKFAIQRTQYSEAAAAWKRGQKGQGGALPVTLKQARVFFK